MLSVFLAAMESTVVATAMPKVVELLGGVLTDLGSWRWVFYVNLPFGVVAIALLAGALSDTAERRRHAFDWTGVVLFTSGVSALLFGILEAGRVGLWTGADVLLPLG